MITLDRLTTDVEAGEIDSVLLAFTDMDGRLPGKRCAPLLGAVVPHAAAD